MHYSNLVGDEDDGRFDAVATCTHCGDIHDLDYIVNGSDRVGLAMRCGIAQITQGISVILGTLDQLEIKEK